MAYFLVTDFRGGLDLRKHEMTSPPGTLRELTNAVINPGGEIEKRKAFVPWVAAPGGTFGLAAVLQDLYVFQQTAARDAKRRADVPLPWVRQRFNGLPSLRTTPTLKTQNLVLATSVTVLTGLIDWDLFDGKIYSTCLGADNKVYHFYDGVHVAQPSDITVPTLGSYIRTFKNRMYCVGGRNMMFSALGAPMEWANATNGSGWINLSSEDGDSTDLLGVEVYYGDIAVLSRNATQTWQVDADPKAFLQKQLIRDFGSIAPRSVKQYGNGDILSLMNSGVRSLQARDIANNASVSDIGSPLDKLFQSGANWIDNAYLSPAMSVVDSLTGRYWLVNGKTMYVLSYFPGPKVTAWSTFTTDFDTDWAVAFMGRVAVRDKNDQIYLYGGLTSDEHDNCPVTATIPYLDAQKAGTHKMFEAFDSIISGEWVVDVSFEPMAPDAWARVGTFSAPTPTQQRMGMEGTSTHVALRMTCNQHEPATIANVLLHYKGADEK